MRPPIATATATATETTTTTNCIRGEHEWERVVVASIEFGVPLSSLVLIALKNNQSKGVCKVVAKVQPGRRVVVVVVVVAVVAVAVAVAVVVAAASVGRVLSNPSATFLQLAHE